MDLAALGVPALPADVAADLFPAFGTQARGRGRNVEDLADWIDLVFVIASLGLLLLVWRKLQRRRTGNLSCRGVGVATAV